MDIIFKAPREKRSHTKVQPLWNLETTSRASEILRKSYFQLRIPYLTKEKVHLRLCKNSQTLPPVPLRFLGKLLEATLDKASGVQDGNAQRRHLSVRIVTKNRVRGLWAAAPRAVAQKPGAIAPGMCTAGGASQGQWWL